MRTSCISGLITLIISSLSVAQPSGHPHDAKTSTSQVPQGGGQTSASLELPVHKIPNIGSGAEFYFSPDSKSLIGNAKREGDESHHVYTLKIDGTDIRRINSIGQDACSFFFPDGSRIAWTSTRDHLDLPPGDWSNPVDYPQGAEIYTSKLDGSDVQRITSNTVYDAEVTVSPDSKHLVFGRQTNRKMDLWRANIDGSDQTQITHLDGWEPGGVQYMPDGKTLLFRAWKTADQGKKKPTPMEIFTVKDNGSDLHQVTSDGGTNWAPYPAPDGRHYAFVKVLPPHNFELFLGDLESSDQLRLTYSDAFDGFPAISPDGRWLQFSSSRGSAPGSREMTIYLMDISSLNVGPRNSAAKTN